MGTFLVSFLAGVLTVAAPCILPLLPVVIGGSISDEEDKRRLSKPIVIALSLAFSIVVFTLILRATTALLGVPQEVWQIISGGIVLVLGLNFLFPHAWEHISAFLKLNQSSQKLFHTSQKHSGMRSDILLGASLGPVFASCSPTYGFILAVVLPQNFAQGLLYLAAYAVGLAGTLLIVSFGGQKIVARMGWLSNPKSWFRRIIGALFVIVGFAVIFGLDKELQAFILENGLYDPIDRFEKSLLN